MSTPIENPLWAGPVLLTPVCLDALMVGTSNQTGDWAAVAVRYQELDLRLGQPQPSPFEIAAAPPPTGIHLSWTVPDALRHGQVDDAGGVAFPLLPNRWLVTRSFVARPGDAPQVTAWVLESDYLGPSALGTHVYPDPTGGDAVLYIGRRFDLGEWKGSTSTYQGAFLRAMGPGAPGYTAVYDNMRNVLAFHDDMQGAQPGLYSYSTFGWFAAPADDPLYGKTAQTPEGFTSEVQWRELMRGVQWSVGNDADLAAARQAWEDWLQAHPQHGGPPLLPAQAQLAAQTVCHGFVYSLAWKGADYFYPINPILNGTTPPTVAIGANPAEAMAAWLANEIGSTEAEDLLLAFQQDQVFDYVDNRSVFLVDAAASRFAENDAGTQWLAYPKGQTSSATEIPAGAYSVPLDAQDTAALVKLNLDQGSLDALQTRLAGLKWELYAAYWKLQNYPRTNPDYGDLARKQIAALTPEIARLRSSDDALKEALRLDHEALATRLAPLGLELKKVDQPRFTARQDPVVLLAGANKDTKFGIRVRDAGDPGLFTRFTGQTLSAIQVVYSAGGVALDQILAAADFPSIAWPAGVQIPKETQDLWFETFLLDTNNAQLIAQQAFAKAKLAPTPAQLAALTALVQRQQTLAWNMQATQLVDTLTIAEVAGLQGVPPDKLSVAAWTPAWAPVYLDWEIEWHPSASSPQHMLDSWKLGELEFEWTGTTVAAAARRYTGRSILNGSSALLLQSKLNKFLDTNPNLGMLPQYQIQELRDMARTIGEFDVLTQSLSGMVEQLIMKQLKMSKVKAAIQDDLAAVLADAASELPDVAANLFFPIHAGHFRLVQLQVVDAFGQILRGSQLSDNLVPVRSNSLVTAGAGNERYMQLAPRVTQGLRLDMRMVQADDDSIRSNSSDLTSAVCGWLLPNHINHSVVVFDPAGNNLGEVLLIDNGNDVVDVGTGLRWDATPGSNSVLGAPPDFGPRLRHLNGFVDGLLLRGAEGSGALQDLLDVVDSSLWKVDPLGQPLQGNLAVLLGRPVALVRALVTLEAEGPDASRQSWKDTGKNITDGFMSVPLPLRIGDIGLSHNGVMGYFLDDDYTRLYPFHGYDRRLAIPRRAMADRRLAPKERLERMMQDLAAADTLPRAEADGYLVPDPGFTLPADGTTTRSLTILVDPRGWIPAVSGYLPVQWLSLPPGPVNSAMSNMFTTFRTGPLLLDSPNIQLPLPASIKGRWTWVERSGVTTWSESAPLASATQVAALPAARPTLREGWLKLSGAQANRNLSGDTNQGDSLER